MQFCKNTMSLQKSFSLYADFHFRSPSSFPFFSPFHFPNISHRKTSYPSPLNFPLFFLLFSFFLKRKKIEKEEECPFFKDFGKIKKKKKIVFLFSIPLLSRWFLWGKKDLEREDEITSFLARSDTLFILL